MSNEYVEPEDLAREITKRMAASSVPLSAFWAQVSGDREVYAEALRRAVPGAPLTVLVVRQAGFDNPNSVLFELVRLLEASRERCLRDLEHASGHEIAVVLLARSGLNVPQASSPIELPAWLPGGGRTVNAIIEDLTWEAEAALSAPALRVADIAEAVFELEGVLLRRMVAVHRSDKNAGDKFLVDLRTDNEQEAGTKFLDILTAFETGRRTVKNPRAFRPSITSTDSLTARLWVLGHRKNPENRDASKGMARALGLPKDMQPSRASLPALIKRPMPVRGEPRSQIFCQQVIATIAAACQLTTAAAHADAYDAYPITLLTSISFDLRRALAAAESLVSRLPDPSG